MCFFLLGIDKFGVGNWKAIAETIESKTPKQIEDHYWEGYMGVHGYCLPTNTMIDGEYRETLSLASTAPPGLDDVLTLSDGLTISNVVERVLHAQSHYGQYLSDDLFRVAVMLGHERGEKVVRDVGKTKTSNDVTAKLAALPGADLPGFMPLREDFEVEYANDAEQILSNMEFNPDDHPSETALKLQVIRIYNRKLEERNARKRFVIDRGLVDFKAQQAREKKMTKEEREEVAKFRVFARFMTKEEFEDMVSVLLLAKRLNQQVDLFKHYQALGLKTLPEVIALEEQKRKAAHQMKVQKQSAPYLMPSLASTSSLQSAGRVASVEESAKKKRGRPSKNAVDSSPDRGNTDTQNERGPTPDGVLESDEDGEFISLD